MSKEMTEFRNIEIQKPKSHHWKNIFLLRDVDIAKILISTVVYSGEEIVLILLVTRMTIVKLNRYV